MKRIISEAEFSAEQLNEISALAEETGLCNQTVKILYGRGIDTKDKIAAFLSPGKDKFLNPFLMSGMREAVEMLKRAREEQWSVAVYGDYDADGVCALTIMRRALQDFGIDALVYVPERKNGYGLNIAALDEIFEEYFPQLIITVDCGISNAEEVEYIKEQGAEVIVTDHHELPERLPDCIIINPKLNDDYPYDNLCGAGVAFKLSCALNGKEAYKDLDFAAIATVADSVPLTGENRDIVAEGLNLINSSPKKNYAEFLSKNQEKVTAQNLAFSIAPKINAAGRMGDAVAALALFLSEDDREIYDYSVKLTVYNTERQKKCDELYLSAKNKIKEKGAKGRVIVLWDESWNSGFIGIVAARLAEEYCRPVLLFVKNGDMLKGSSRSVYGVNIFEALKACSHLLAEFGGHSQAAGINVAEENLDALEEALNDYFHENYTAEAFTPTCYVNGEFTSLSKKFVHELEMLEPCGVGNRKPQFFMNVSDLKTRPLKLNSPHIAVKCDALDLVYFAGARYANLIKSHLPKRLVFEYNLSSYHGREQIGGYIRDVIYQSESCAFASDEIDANNLLNLCGSEVSVIRRDITKEEAQSRIDNCGEYGTVFIASCVQTLKKYALKGLEVNLFTFSAGSLSSVVLISPQSGCDLSAYENVVFLDDPARITLSSLDGKCVDVCKDFDGIASLRALDSNRDNLGKIFKLLDANSFNLSGETLSDIAFAFKSEFSPLQILFALKVFEELKLVALNNGRLTVDRGKKTQLTNSEIYNFIVSEIE